MRVGTTITTGIATALLTLGVPTSFLIRWRQGKRDRHKEEQLEEEAYRLFVEYHAACKRGDAAEVERAWTRYLEFFNHHVLDPAAYERKFVKRLEQGSEDLNAIIAKRV